MKVYDFIFVVLVYRNTQDLVDFFASMSLNNIKVIVVNSFYDVETENKFISIAKDNDADFLSIPNKGYGFGNNRGCEYALKNYHFNYLIISNADIIIKKLSIENIELDVITAPKILTLKGKRQNPHLPYYTPLYDKIKYYVFKNDIRWLLLFIFAISRFYREWYLFTYKIKCAKSTIYAAHGAFIIIPQAILSSIYPIYNEKMFLFIEEEHFAQLARHRGFKIKYNPQIEILHKEDGSMKLSPNDNTRSITRNSYVEYYKYWHSQQNQ